MMKMLGSCSLLAIWFVVMSEQKVTSGTLPRTDVSRAKNATKTLSNGHQIANRFPNGDSKRNFNGCLKDDMIPL